MKNTKRLYILIICGFLFASRFAFAGSMITGKVTGTSGIALSGVEVTLEGSQLKTVTDQHGNFRIEAGQFPATLAFFSPGFEPSVSQVISGQEDVKVTLFKGGMQEVAYGVQDKISVTGATFILSGEELLNSRSNNLMVALQGRLPGMRIIQTDGEPGRESFDAQVRGYNSPNNNGVMYVVDGVERSITGIDIFEVESVTVLKDAAATSMYGMRGSGGVLLVTTRKGAEGKSKISVSIDQAFQAPTRLPKMVSAFDYANMYNRRLANDTLYSDRQSIASGGTGIDHRATVFYTPYELDRYRLADMTDYYPSRDMLGDFMKDYSSLSRVNVNFTGGSAFMKYFTSVGYSDQGGLFNSEPFEKYSYNNSSFTRRFNFRTNLDINLNKTLDMWFKIGGYMEKVNLPYVGSGLGWNDLIEKLYQTPNNAYTDLTPAGEVVIKRDKLSFSTLRSVYGDINRSGSQLQTNTRLNNTFGIRQKLDKVTEGLSASAQLSFDIYSTGKQTRSRSYEAYEVVVAKDATGKDVPGFVKVTGTANSTLSDGFTTSFYYMYNMRAWLDYNRIFGGKHSLSGKLLAERHMQQQQVLIATNYLGLAGRLAYGFDNRYFAEFNFGYQGSEQFKKGNRFGFFPSLSAGWVVSNENFLKDSKAINFLKVRASAGQTGNAAFAYGSTNQYLFLDTWNSDAQETQLGNPSIKWETNTMYNAGMEAGLFDAFYFEADLFFNRNTDLIIRDVAIIPVGFLGTGSATLPPLNLGEMTNRGFELVLGYNKQFNKDFSLSLSSNIAFCRNEQGYMGELAYDENYAYPFRKEGYPLNNHWGYKTAGLFASQDEINKWPNQSALGGVPIPGDIKYVDLTGDGIVDLQDQAPLAIGAAPEITGGLQARVSYKWIDLTAFFNGAARRNVYLNGFGRWSNTDNFTQYMTNAWTPELAASGKPAVYPRLGKESTNFIKSDYWIEDGSYLRLRNVELGVTLPEKVSGLIGAGSIRFYANGFNLMVWDKLPNDDFDPESANSSTTNYPLLKAYNFGVCVKF